MPTLSSCSFVRFCILCLPVLLLFSSCRSTRYYNQRAMFRLTNKKGEQLDSSKLRVAVNRTAKNYLIQPNDYVEVQVYTNKGEKIIDPNSELLFGQGPGATSGSVARGGAGGGAQGAATGSSARGASEFLVQADGTAMLPMIGRTQLAGLSLLEADSVLRARFSQFYKEPFAVTHVTNNRIIILGAPGGKVIPLTNDNMNLLEILALAGGVDGSGGGGSGLARFGGNASNIRIIRGDLKNPQIQQIDLTTLDGMRRANLQMEPNDVVYIEPIRRPFLETLADGAPVLSALSILLTTTTIFITYFR